MTEISATVVIRLLRRTHIGRDEDCWLWSGCLSRDGYGHIGVKRSSQLVHRVMYRAAFGEIPEGMTVDHLCFNRRCCNPAHLQLLTAEENRARRQMALRGLCGKGLHEMTAANKVIDSRGRPCCRACRDTYQRAYQKRWYRENRERHAARGAAAYRRRKAAKHRD